MDPIATYFAEARTRAEANDKLESSRPKRAPCRRRNVVISNLKKQQHYEPCNWEPLLPITIHYGSFPDQGYTYKEVSNASVFELFDLSSFSDNPDVISFLDYVNAERTQRSLQPMSINPYLTCAATVYCANGVGMRRGDGKLTSGADHTLIYNYNGVNVGESTVHGYDPLVSSFIGYDNPITVVASVGLGPEHGQTNQNYFLHFQQRFNNFLIDPDLTNIGIVQRLSPSDSVDPAKSLYIVAAPPPTNAMSKPVPTKTILKPGSLSAGTFLGSRITIDSLPITINSFYGTPF